MEATSVPPAKSPLSATSSRPIIAASARFYIVWTARILLPIVYLLSTANFAIIPVSDTNDRNESPPQLALNSDTHSHLTERKQATVRTISESSVILVITHSRDVYLARTLHSIFTFHPGGSKWPVIISKDQQDGQHSAIDGVISHFHQIAKRRNITFVEWAHANCYFDLPVAGTISPFVDIRAYRRISKHYFWALRRVFSPPAGQPFRKDVSRVVIIEDDMEIAPDFFSYFTALAPFLDSNHDVYCISAWNDNGIPSLSLNESRLYRTDFFPGLGWMLNRRLWSELSEKWPDFFWDDWMRHPDQSRNRQCIRPEVSRTANFGEKGVSQSFHYTAHVSKVVVATTTVDFSKVDLSHLEADNYFRYFFSRMSNATRLKYLNFLGPRGPDTDVIAFYPPGRLNAVTKRTGIMIDDRNGILRTSYLGVVVIPWKGHWAFIVDNNWRPPEGYTLGSFECCSFN